MITVGVPTYNEEKVIGLCLKSILPQIKKNDEIIVVASGCTDNTVNVVKELAKKHKQIKLFTEKERKGKASALNIILKNAKGSVIVQTDGDVILEKNSIKHLLKHFKDSKIGAVSGRPIPVIPKNNLFYNWSLMSYKNMHKIRLKEAKLNEFWHVSGYLFAQRKDALRTMPVNVKGSTDGTMGWLINKKYNITYEPKSKVLVKCPLTIRDFIRQKSRARAGFYQLKKRYGIPPRSVKSEILQILPKQIKTLKSFKELFNFLISGVVYAYTWFKGWLFVKQDKSILEVWKHVESTKLVKEYEN